MTGRAKVWNPPPGAREWLRELLDDWVSGQTPEATAQQCPCLLCGSTFAAASLVGRLESAAELDPEHVQRLMSTLRQSRSGAPYQYPSGIAPGQGLGGESPAGETRDPEVPA